VQCAIRDGQRKHTSKTKVRAVRKDLAKRKEEINRVSRMPNARDFLEKGRGSLRINIL